uniref:Uncharacterized protein n=1 Tax=Hyaloperonospora arabidopsidis (strain Emoy2) TaxID=559515 RepID=M4BFS4_HYAAE
MDATTNLVINASHPVIETLTDEQIVADVFAEAEQEAASELLDSLQGKAASFPLAEDLDRILRQYKRYVASSRSKSSKQVTLNYLIRCSKGEERAQISLYYSL